VPSAAIDTALEVAGIDGSVRAETLEPSTYVTLGAALRAVDAF